MVKLLKYRAYFITVVFGLFGMGLSTLLRIDELKFLYTSIALLISLVISLMVSFFLKLKRNTKTKNRLKLISLVLFLFLLTVFFLFIQAYNTRTFSYHDNEASTLTYYVKGKTLQPMSKQYSQLYLDQKKEYISDEKLVAKFGGPLKADQVWTSDSIKSNRMYLIVTYIIVVLFFVSLVCMLTEILVLWYPKSTARSTEDLPENE